MFLHKVVENQELVEVRQEELNAMRAQRDECDRETSEEMDVIREKMEQTRAGHKAEVEEYRQRLEEVERVSAIEQDELRRRSEAAETELMGMIKVKGLPLSFTCCYLDLFFSSNTQWKCMRDFIPSIYVHT